MSPTETLPTESATLVHAPTRRLTGYDAPIQGCVYICSVAPVPRFAHRDHNVVVKTPQGDRVGLGVDYFLPAAPRGSHRVLAIYDTFVILRLLDGWKENSVSQSFEPRSIPSFVVASDIMAQWSSSLIGGSKNVFPGVGLIRNSEPDADELSRLKSINTAWCEWCVNDAGQHHANNHLNDIHLIHRRAAEWLYDTGAHQFPWFKERKQQDLKDCPACLEKIQAKVFYCPHCKVELVKFHINYGIAPDDFLKPFVDKELERMTQPGV